MENSANLSDGAQQADIVSSEHAETMFSADQAETNMVKLVDGKLTPTGNTDADVSDDMPRIRLGSDEERALEGDEKKKYENSDAALRAGNVIDISVMPNDPIAVADITGNPDAGSDVNTGLPSEDAPNNDTTAQTSDATQTYGFDVRNMVPSTPGSPDPMQPMPGIPETPPYNPFPGPEIPDLPGTPKPGTPEIPEPGQPEHSPDVNAVTDGRIGFVTYTAGVSGVVDENELEPGEAVPGNQYEGMSAGIDSEGRAAANTSNTDAEGMRVNGAVGGSGRPYEVDLHDANEYQPGERPEEAREAASLPRELMDESSVEARGMYSGSDRSDQKSTDGLDRSGNNLDTNPDFLR